MEQELAKNKYEASLAEETQQQQPRKPRTLGELQRSRSTSDSSNLSAMEKALRNPPQKVMMAKASAYQPHVGSRGETTLNEILQGHLEELNRQAEYNQRYLNSI